MSKKAMDKRYAFEWYMKAEDERYWRMTKQLVDSLIKKLTSLIGLSTVVNIALVIFLVMFCK